MTPTSIQLYVSNSGHDDNPGTLEQPFATLHRAKQEIRRLKQKHDAGAITVFVREGIYYFSEPLVFTPEDSGSESQPIQYCAYPQEKVVISGAVRLPPLKWKRYQGNILKARVTEVMSSVPDFDQFFVGGEKQIRARYPNVDPSYPLMDGPGYIQAAGGTDQRPDKELIFDPNTFTKKNWRQPHTGIVHVFQSHYWGNMQYRITDVDRENNKIYLGEGGFQLQRSYGINHRSRFYVENILEELDAPGEWYFDSQEGILYYYPCDGMDMNDTVVEIVSLKQLIEFRGNPESPVSHLTLSGFTLTHTSTVFLEPYEDLSRGDWAIHRGGAVFLEGATDCHIQDIYFDSVGGNGVFLSGYNRRNTITGCKFERCGESAVCAVGFSSAVRMYRTWETMGKAQDYDDQAGPKSPDYPQDCTISNNIMHDIGIYGKQTAGIFVSMSRRITMSHNTIYEVPRAAICINDGTWGGHIVEYNDIWETVRETGEHGPFNAWGRDRQWSDGAQMDGNPDEGMNKKAVYLDALEPNIIRGNRIVNMRKSVSAGNWTIDLDDGSSYYRIYNNLCLGSTLKLRDGYDRKVENNIFVSPVPLGFHVWPEKSEDEFVHNIVVVAGCRPGEQQPTDATYGPIRMPDHPWGMRIDFNLYWNVNNNRFLVRERAPEKEYGWKEWQAYGYDENSYFGDPLFVDPASGDFRLRPESPAYQLGFQPFAMDDFGHTQTRIRPFGGEFEQSMTVELQADARGGEVWYTLDGSEPSPESSTSYRYEGPIHLSQSTTITACTFKNGMAVGFVQSAHFSKVNQIERPDWVGSVASGTCSRSKEKGIGTGGCPTAQGVGMAWSYTFRHQRWRFN